jgi:hypothetical protein
MRLTSFVEAGPNAWRVYMIIGTNIRYIGVAIQGAASAFFRPIRGAGRMFANMVALEQRLETAAQSVWRNAERKAWVS